MTADALDFDGDTPPLQLIRPLTVRQQRHNWSAHSNMSSAFILPVAPVRNRHLPHQERSRATRDRILGALALLLEHKRFDAITTAELTRVARCSMSSLYARFPTKDALLSAFHNRFFENS